MTPFPVSHSVLSAEALAAFIKDKYPLNGVVNCALFRTGINHTYFLSDQDTKYALRVYSHHWRSKPEISEEVALLRLFQEHHLGVSFPIQDRDGGFIQEINAPEGMRYAVLFSFAQGGKIRFLDQETCFSIGALMAQMHQLSSDRRIQRITYNRASLLEWPYEQLKQFFPEELPEMAFIKDLADFFPQADFENIPNGVVHLDIWYDNMAVTEDKEITLFDFDFCGNGAQVLDLGYFCKQLFHVETDKQAYELKKKHFLQGYQSVRPLSDHELQFMPKAGLAVFVFFLGVQAQRFDWSNIFLSENYLKMFFIPRLKSWMEYNKIEK